MEFITILFILEIVEIEDVLDAMLHLHEESGDDIYFMWGAYGHEE